MNLDDIIVKVDNHECFIPDLQDRSTTLLLDEYCKKHPYFERTVREINSMFRYITFSDVCNTIKYLINNEFKDILLKDLDENVNKKYIFIYDGEMKSGFYFTLLFLKYLYDSLDVLGEDLNRYSNRIILEEYDNIKKNNLDVEHNDNDVQYVFVDDGAYTGYQMLGYAKTIPHPIVILIACNEDARDRLMMIDNIRLFIGSLYPNTFDMDIDHIFKQLDVFYESNGKIYSLLDSTLCRGHDPDAISNFYFQHKHPDYVSIPQCLFRFPDPDVVDRILTLKEKYELLKREVGSYINQSDYDILGQVEDIRIKLYSFIQDVDINGEELYKPFYKDERYVNILK